MSPSQRDAADRFATVLERPLAKDVLLAPVRPAMATCNRASGVRVAPGWGLALRGFVWRVTAGDRLLATIAAMPTGFTITTTPAAKPWTLTAGRDTSTVWDGETKLAAGRAKTFSKWGYWTGDRRLTTALSLHRDLDLDERVVILMALLGNLGPPTGDPSD